MLSHLSRAARRPFAIAARSLRRRRSNLLELAGFACLSVAAWTVDVGWGLAVAGVSLLVIGAATGSESPER